MCVHGRFIARIRCQPRTKPHRTIWRSPWQMSTDEHTLALTTETHQNGLHTLFAPSTSARSVSSISVRHPACSASPPRSPTTLFLIGLLASCRARIRNAWTPITLRDIHIPTCLAEARLLIGDRVWPHLTLRHVKEQLVLASVGTY